MQSNDSRVICVLGMHRSGTSCLVSALERAGLFVGLVSTTNRENVKIWRLNEEILKYSGGKWSNPPSVILWQSRHETIRDQIIDEYFSGKELWGFKDPRLLLTLDVWQDKLPQIEFVGTFRHPDAVAESLAVRDGLSRTESMRLWRIYNARLLKVWIEHGPFPVISFDRDEAPYSNCLNKILKRLGLRQNLENVDLLKRHHTCHGMSDDVTDEIRRIYFQLMQLE